MRSKKTIHVFEYNWLNKQPDDFFLAFFRLGVK